MTRHQHRKLTAAKRQIVGGGFISLESCKCGAMRSVVQKGTNGRIVASTWEVEPEEEPMDLLDQDPSNTNDGDL
jgi:hypothetical protein